MAISSPNIDLEQLIFRSDFHKFRKIVRALLARCLLYSHGILAVWLTGTILNNQGLYYIVYPICGFLFVLETVLILYYRYGCEWKWFCACFVCYLLTVVPMLWMVRLDDIDKALANKSSALNTSADGLLLSSPNETTPRTLLSTILKDESLQELFKDQPVPSLIEQSMMITLIICRWLLPRGRIDRNSLSQLLIMYSAISADILDFSDVITREEVVKHSTLKYIILAVWSWSLVQFMVVTTSAFTYRRRQRQPDLEAVGGHSITESDDRSEMISILQIFFMQDGPFLVTRCYAISIGVLNYMIMFFALKNGITVILGLYRLFVLCGCIGREGNDLLRRSEIQRSMESLDDLSLQSKSSRKKDKGKKVHFKSGKGKPQKY